MKTKERGRSWHSATKNYLPEGKPGHGHHQAASARQEGCGNPDQVPAQRCGCSCLWLQSAWACCFQRWVTDTAYMRCFCCQHKTPILPTVSLFFEEEDVSFSLSQQPPHPSWLLLISTAGRLALLNVDLHKADSRATTVLLLFCGLAFYPTVYLCLLAGVLHSLPLKVNNNHW